MLRKFSPLFKVSVFIFSFIVLSRLITLLEFFVFCKTRYFPFSTNYFFTTINVSDSKAFASIVINGYSLVPLSKAGIYNLNFLPLYPILLKITSLGVFDKTYLNVFILAFIINTVLLFLTCFFSYKYITLTRNNKTMGLSSTVLLTIGPFAYFSMETMSETLFMLLFIMGLYCLKKKYYLRMGLCGALLSATRTIGVCFVLVILVDIIAQYLQNEKEKSFKGFFKFLFIHSTLILAVALTPLGLISYMLFLQIKFNDGLAFIHTQIYGYGHTYIGYFKILFNANPIVMIIVIYSLIISVYLIIEKKYSEAVLPIINYLLIGSTTLLSLPRYFFASFSIMYGSLDLLNRIKFKNKTLKMVCNYIPIELACLFECFLIYCVFLYRYEIIT